MNRLPRITVITPSFNQARFLERTMVSVLDQGYEGLEYIVVDGGSSDGSVPVIEGYEAELAWWTSGEDSGPADAIGKALRFATGEVVAVVPADDLLLPFALQRVAERFADADEPDWVIGSADRVDADDRVLDRPARPRMRTLNELLRHGTASVPAAATFYRRSVLDEAGPLEIGLRHAHLFDLNCRLLAAGISPTALEQTIASQRLHAASLSARDRMGMRHEESRVVWRYVHEQRPLTPRIRRRAIAAAQAA